MHNEQMRPEHVRRAAANVQVCVLCIWAKLNEIEKPRKRNE